MDRNFEAAWNAYPADRRRNKSSCHTHFLQAVGEGLTAEELGRAIKSYATETSGYTRSKVCFSDNWFREQRWQRHVDEMRKAKIEKAEQAENHLKQRADYVKNHHWMCAHISIAEAGKLLLRGLVSEDELRRAGVVY